MEHLAPPIEGMDPRTVQGAWAEWLRHFKWDLWTTPTFATKPSDTQVRYAVGRWLERLGRRVYAAVTVEQGGVGGRWHAHVLVGGVGFHPSVPGTVAGAWRWGQVAVERYDPRLDRRGTTTGACWYLSKDPGAVEVVGRPRIWRQRAPHGITRNQPEYPE